jgi:hypothetical protein
MRSDGTHTEARRAPSFVSIACGLGVGLLCLTPTVTSTAQEAISHEYRIKAAFLCNFTRFIDWPSGSFPDAASPIVIGVIGADPFGGELANVLRGRRVHGRPLVARTIGADEDARSVHLLFVGVSAPEGRARLLQTLQRYPVTTVGESPEFAKEGGIITFVIKGDKVRFEINAAAAERAGIRISAHLEKLATVVRRANQQKEVTCDRCVTSRSGGN